MRVDSETGEIDSDADGEDNIRAFRPRRPGTRRASISTTGSSSSDDAKTLTALSRTVEVEGASDRLGLGALRETLDVSEAARRLLTQDQIESRARHEAEVDRVRDEYERAANAAELRYASESRRGREERERLQKEVVRLEDEVKAQRKAKKKHKKSVIDLEIKLAELRETGESKRAMLALLAPGVPPLAAELARRIPDIFSLIRTVVGGKAPVSARAVDEDAVQDQAAAIRFAGRLFDTSNEDVLDDLKKLAYNVVVDEKGDALIVDEWERVQRYVWSALQRASEAESASREDQRGSQASGGSAAGDE